MWSDPKSDVIRYVGKGLMRRPYEHLGNSRAQYQLGRMLNKRVREGFSPTPNIALYTNDEQEAFDLEISLIKKYGREDLGTGPLFNKTDGGEGSSGLSEEARKKKSEFWKQFHKDNPTFASDRLKERYSKPNPKTNSEGQKAHYAIEENRIKLSKAIKKSYEEHPEIGDKISKSIKITLAKPEVKEKRSAASKEVCSRPEVIAKRVATAKINGQSEEGKAMAKARSLASWATRRARMANV
jgi:hypothetical protein